MKLVVKAIFAVFVVLGTLSFFQNQPSPNFISEIKQKLTVESAPQFQEIKNNKEPIFGYDVLGLAMYCNVFLKAPKLPYLSTLLATFGNPIPCIEKRIAQGGMTTIQIDLIDATCHRNKVCPAGAPSPTDLKVIQKRANTIQALAKKYPGIEWWVSPALEHDVKDEKKVKEMMAAAKKGCPSCNVINSPFSGAKTQPLELHGIAVKAFAISADGANMLDADNIKNDGNDFQHRISGSYKTAGWINEFNGRCTGEKTFTPPLKRKEKPTLDLFKQIYRVLIKSEPDFPPTPKQCKSVRDISAKNKEINKPNAENYCNLPDTDPRENDIRGNKPLLILRKAGAKDEEMSILNSQGKKVGCFKYYGTYTVKGLHRWYEGNCSKLTPTQLMDKLGNEWGFVMDKSGQCIRFNSIRRQGVYRDK